MSPFGNVPFREQESGRRVALWLGASLLSLAIPGAAAAQTGASIDKFALPDVQLYPQEIASGPDGRMLVPMKFAGTLGFVDSFGKVTQTVLPGGTTMPFGVAVGTDGSSGPVFFVTEYFGNSVIVVKPSGKALEVPIPTPNALPTVITWGPDGAAWCVELTGHKIARITPKGEITEYATPTAESFPKAIAVGADGNLWVAEGEANKIARFIPPLICSPVPCPGAPIADPWTEFDVPTEDSGPYRIIPGPDGALYFTEFSAGKIGRVTTAGKMSEFQIPTLDSGPRGIALGPDGALWFTESKSDKIGRMTPDGRFSEYPIPVSDDERRSPTLYLLPSNPGNLQAIAFGLDGNAWITDSYRNKILRVNLAPKNE